MDTTLRKYLLFLFLFGVIGTGTELILLDHMEDVWQWTPLVLLALSLPPLGVIVLLRRRAALLLFRSVVWLFIPGGILGLYFHYTGNTEFEIEMYPDIGSLELFLESITGATPALAPGAMVLLGLIGHCYAYKHPLNNRT